MIKLYFTVSAVVMFGQRLDSMMREVFSNLRDSGILLGVLVFGTIHSHKEEETLISSMVSPGLVLCGLWVLFLIIVLTAV